MTRFVASLAAAALVLGSAGQPAVTPDGLPSVANGLSLDGIMPAPEPAPDGRDDAPGAQGGSVLPR